MCRGSEILMYCHMENAYLVCAGLEYTKEDPREFFMYPRFKNFTSFADLLLTRREDFRLFFVSLSLSISLYLFLVPPAIAMFSALMPEGAKTL